MRHEWQGCLLLRSNCKDSIVGARQIMLRTNRSSKLSLTIGKGVMIKYPGSFVGSQQIKQFCSRALITNHVVTSHYEQRVLLFQARSHVSVVDRTNKTEWGPGARLRALGGVFRGQSPLKLSRFQLYRCCRRALLERPGYIVNTFFSSQFQSIDNMNQVQLYCQANFALPESRGRFNSKLIEIWDTHFAFEARV